MAASLLEADLELKEALAALEAALAEVRKLPFEERKGALREVDPVSARVRRARNAFRLQVTRVTDETQKTVHSNRLHKYGAEHDTLEKQLKALKTPPKPAADSADNREMHPILGDGSALNDKRAVMDMAVNAQGENLRTLRNIENLVEMTHDSAVVVAENLAIDREKHRAIHVELDAVQRSTTKAKRELTWFERQKSSFRCVLFVIIVVVIGIAGLVGYLIYRKHHGSSSPPPTNSPVLPPPSPSPPVTISR
jgi:hypothetical protein